MTEFYTDASVGMIVEWARNRMNQDKETVLRNLLFIYKVSISSLLSGKVDEKKLLRAVKNTVQYGRYLHSVLVTLRFGYITSKACFLSSSSSASVVSSRTML